MSVKRIELGGVPVDDVSMSACVALAREGIENGRQMAVLAVNPEKVMTARENPELRDVLCSAELLIPDGIGAVVAARLKGAKTIQRVPGSELMPELCQMAANEGHSIFLFGASEEVNATAAEELCRRYPGLTIAGRQNGYLDSSDHAPLCERINSSGAKLLFLALGSPKQELFIKEYRDSLTVNIMQGVGGTFDVIAGNVKRAPEAWRRINLEWLYRLLSQPKRMLRQTALPRFVWLMLKEQLTGKSV